MFAYYVSLYLGRTYKSLYSLMLHIYYLKYESFLKVIIYFKFQYFNKYNYLKIEY